MFAWLSKNYFFLFSKPAIKPWIDRYRFACLKAALIEVFLRRHAEAGIVDGVGLRLCEISEELDRPIDPPPYLSAGFNPSRHHANRYEMGSTSLVSNGLRLRCISVEHPLYSFLCEHAKLSRLVHVEGRSLFLRCSTVERARQWCDADVSACHAQTPGFLRDALFFNP